MGDKILYLNSKAKLPKICEKFLDIFKVFHTIEIRNKSIITCESLTNTQASAHFYYDFEQLESN